MIGKKSVSMSITDAIMRYECELEQPQPGISNMRARPTISAAQSVRRSSAPTRRAI